MALVVKDRVKETTSTTGTGTLTLGGAVTGFQTFTSVLSNSDTTYYAIFESSTGQFEVGLGTFTSSGTTLARTTVLESSNSGNAINLTAGAADVFITQPAEKAVYLDASGHIAAADGRNVTNVAASTATTAGTVTTAAQPNITSVGTLTGLDINGDLNAVDNIVLATAMYHEGDTDTFLSFGSGGDSINLVTGSSTRLTATNSGVTINDITINGSTISDAGTFTIDVGGEIELDASSGTVRFENSGTRYGSVYQSSSNFVLQSDTSDGDILFLGNDGGSYINALTLDMSDAGTATFNHDVKVNDNGNFFAGTSGDLAIYHDGSNSYIVEQGTGNLNITSNSDLTLDVSGDIILDTDGGEVWLKDGGTNFGRFFQSSGNLYINHPNQDQDIIIQGNDGGANVNALTFDMSDAGTATFNHDIKLGPSGGDVFIYYNGAKWLSTPSNALYLSLGDSGGNPWSGNTGTRLMFGSADSNAISGYYIGTNQENYGGNYNKLDIDYATGIRIKADKQYGGTRFYDASNDALLLNVGVGNTDVGVVNNLTVGGNITVPANIYHEGDSDTYLQFDAADSFRIVVGNTQTFKTTTSDITLGANLKVEDHVLKVGDISADNYLQLEQDYADGRGFTYQHDNASTFQNLQGSLNQYMVLGDSDPSSTDTLFGVSIYDSAYYPRFKVAGNGDTTIYGNLTVPASIIHEGDTDTYVNFPDAGNAINFVAGGVSVKYLAAAYESITVPVFNYAAYFDEVAQLTGTTPTINAATSGAFYLTMSGNTTFTFTGTSSNWGIGFVLYLTGNGSTVTWPGTVDWAGGTAPDAPANGEVDVLVFTTRDGSNWFGALAIDAAA